MDPVLYLYSPLFSLLLVPSRSLNRRLIKCSLSFTSLAIRLLDQPMKIDLIVDPIRAVPLASRVAPAPVAKAPVPARFVSLTAPLSRRILIRTHRTGPVRRRRGGAPRRGPKPTPKTAADLDAEMEVR